MDVSVTKKISTQLSALLPPSATELPISQTTQVSKICLFKVIVLVIPSSFPLYRLLR